MFLYLDSFFSPLTAFSTEFSKPLENTCCRENSTAEIVVHTCHYHPPSSISWFIDSIPVVESKKYEIISDGYKHTLKIHRITKMDEGQLTISCNDEECSAKLIVDGQYNNGMNEKFLNTVTVNDKTEIIHDSRNCPLYKSIFNADENNLIHNFSCFKIHEKRVTLTKFDKENFHQYPSNGQTLSKPRKTNKKPSKIGEMINKKLNYLHKFHISNFLLMNINNIQPKSVLDYLSLVGKIRNNKNYLINKFPPWKRNINKISKKNMNDNNSIHSNNNFKRIQKKSIKKYFHKKKRFYWFTYNKILEPKLYFRPIKYSNKIS